MAEEFSSEANSTNGSNLNLDEQQMLYVLRKERHDFIKQKGKNDFSINIVQETIKAHEDEMKKVLKWQAELESENRQLEAESENIIQTKLNLENDLSMMKNMTEVFCEQLDQLKSTLQVITVNTENYGESKTQICTEIDQYLNKQNTNQKIYEEKIAIKQALVNTEVNINNNVIQEKKLMIEKQNEEVLLLATNEKQLLTILEQGKNRNLQLENELKNIKIERKDLQEEYSKLQEKFSESKNKYNSDQTNYEDKNKTLKRNIEIEKERITEIQSSIELLKQKHTEIDEQISQVQIDLNNLDTKQCEKEEQFDNLLSKLDEIKKNMLNEDEEKKTEIVSLQQKLEQETEKNERFKEENKQLKGQLEDNLKSLESLEEKLVTKMRDKDETIAQLEDIKQKNKENGEANDNKIKELHEKINEVKIKNNQKRETNNNCKNDIEDKQKSIYKIDEKIHSTTNEKLAILSKKKSTFKNFHDELKSLKKEHQALKSEMQKVNKTEKTIKVTEKAYDDKINKFEKDIKQFEEIMDTVMKNNNDKFIKEKRTEEESIKTMLLQVTELKASKENLQNEFATKIQDILDITNKIEAKKNEEQQQNVDNFLKKKEFKSPTLPNKSRRKTMSTITTSTPITNSNKPSTKTENSFTQNDVNDKQINISPIEINNSDDIAIFNKNIPLTQKTESEKTEYKENPMKKQKTVNLWPTDNETTDDSYNFNKKNSETQKSDNKKSDFLKPIKLSSLNSDSNKNKNIPSQKSQTKKVDFKTSQNKTFKWTINSESSDDDGKNNIITSTQKPDYEKNVSQIEPEKKRSVYDFMDSENENTIFESLKNTSNIKSTQKSNVDQFKPTEIRKRTAKHFFTTDNDSSDDSFFGKMDKSKRITSNLNNKPTAIINLETSLSD